jgi:hypothetical protein
VRFSEREVQFLPSPQTRRKAQKLNPMQEIISSNNLERLKQVLFPLEVTPEIDRLCVQPAVKSHFIVKSTIDKIAGAVALFGFSGYMIKIDEDNTLKFWIY